MKKAPLVIIAFSRPETTRQVLDAINNQSDRDLFLICDGPRRNRPAEAMAVDEVRRQFAALTWRAKVRTNYASENLGLRRRVASGLSWVFEQVSDRAIIVEDDCVPSEDFFRFCDVLLERFQDDSRIMALCGTDYAGRYSFPSASYYFSRYPLFWGWATWRRAWACYDDEMTALDDGSLDSVLRSTLDLWRARTYWKMILRRVQTGKMQSWGYRWLLSCWANRGLCVYPTGNLVRNVGFGDVASNTAGRSEYDRGGTSPLANPLKSPPVTVADPIADRVIENRYFSKDLYSRAVWLLRALVRASRRTTKGAQ